MNNQEKSLTRRRPRGVPTMCCTRQQQSVFLIFWTQNLVKGLPLRQLLNPSGPLWSYLMGINRYHFHWRQWTRQLCEGCFVVRWWSQSPQPTMPA